jgi:hypothetical protein
MTGRFGSVADEPQMRVRLLHVRRNQDLERTSARLDLVVAWGHLLGESL